MFDLARKNAEHQSPRTFITLGIIDALCSTLLDHFWNDNETDNEDRRNTSWNSSCPGFDLAPCSSFRFRGVQERPTRIQSLRAPEPSRSRAPAPEPESSRAPTPAEASRNVSQECRASEPQNLRAPELQLQSLTAPGPQRQNCRVPELLLQTMRRGTSHNNAEPQSPRTFALQSSSARASKLQSPSSSRGVEERLTRMQSLRARNVSQQCRASESHNLRAPELQLQSLKAPEPQSQNCRVPRLLLQLQPQHWSVRAPDATRVQHMSRRCQMNEKQWKSMKIYENL